MFCLSFSLWILIQWREPWVSDKCHNEGYTIPTFSSRINGYIVEKRFIYYTCTPNLLIPPLFSCCEVRIDTLDALTPRSTYLIRLLVHKLDVQSVLHLHNFVLHTMSHSPFFYIQLYPLTPTHINSVVH